MANEPGATPYQGGVPRAAVTVTGDAWPPPGQGSTVLPDVIVDSGASESMLRNESTAGLKLTIVGVAVGDKPMGRMTALKVEFVNGGWSFKAKQGAVEVARTCTRPFALGGNNMLGNDQLGEAGCGHDNRPTQKTGTIYVMPS